jgi:hypothetical protein
MREESMFEKQIEIEGIQHLTLVEMASSLVVEGWDEPTLVVQLSQGDENDLTVEQSEASLQLSARNSCKIKVPAHLPVKARHVRGNMKVQTLSRLDAEQVRGNLRAEDLSEMVVAEVYGNLRTMTVQSLHVPGTIYGDARLDFSDRADVQNVRGNLAVRNTGTLRTTRVGGNLTVKEIAERLDADEIGGNAALKNVAGAVSIDKVAGNLAAKDLSGGARVPRIGGNLTLSGALAAGRSYHFHVGGNAAVRLPEETGADVTLHAGGKLLSAVELEQDEEADGRWRGTLGAGGAELVIEAGGNIVLGGGREDWAVAAGLGEEVSRQVEEALEAVDFEAIGRQVSEEMETAMSRLRVKLESVDWERMGHQAQQAVERAMSHMQQEMDRMADRAVRQQERAERRRTRVDRRRHAADSPVAWPEESRSETAAEPDVWSEEATADTETDFGPDRDEERLSILRMVEQGQISPQEAEMLLDALE